MSKNRNVNQHAGGKSGLGLAQAVAPPRAALAGPHADAEDGKQLEKVLGVALALVCTVVFPWVLLTLKSAGELQDAARVKINTLKKETREGFRQDSADLQAMAEKRVERLNKEVDLLGEKSDAIVAKWTNSWEQLHQKMGRLEARIQVLRKGRPK